MTRSLFLMFALAVLVPAAPVFADDAPPTAEQLEQAKKAFADGKSLHDAGKLPEAIEKFKESYRLSKNPLLLYNIGFTLDEAGQKDAALLYYRKFLSDAPQTAPQRQQVTDRVKVLEKEKLDADLAGTGTATPPGNNTTEPKADEHKTVKIKPAGTYGANDFQHQVVEDAPPGKPLDLTASVPEDSGFVVTLAYRGSGDAAFTIKQMKWRYRELVGRIPAAKMAGNSVQYYIEVKDPAGTVIAKSGKSTSPNLVNIEAGATERFYPDMTDEGEKISASKMRSQDDDDDPLGTRKAQREKEAKEAADAQRDQPVGPQNGILDVGSQKFVYTKWGSTGTAAALLGLSMVFYIEAGKQASALADDAKTCPGGGTPPCRSFDSYDKDLQAAGKRDQTISNTTLVFGVLTAGVAGYFWYRELTAKKHGELNAKAKAAAPNPDTSWVVVPAIVPDGNNNFVGAAAAARF